MLYICQQLAKSCDNSFYLYIILKKFPIKAAARYYIERVRRLVDHSDIKEKYQMMLKSRNIHTANNPQHLNQQKIIRTKIQRTMHFTFFVEQDIQLHITKKYILVNLKQLYY